MTSSKHEITRADIISMEAYAAERDERRARLTAIKRDRRIEVGPHAMIYFENYETMWMQIHEMLYIERGGDEQIADELAAYSPLVPNGRELVATLMFEIGDRRLRDRVLSGLGGVEHTVTLSFAGETVTAVPEGDVERTDKEGRASSVHFLHFPFTEDQIDAFCAPDCQVILGIGHRNYAHMAVLPEAVRAALAGDFA